MGRLLILIALIVVVILLWKAFGPRQLPWARKNTRPPAPKGPDDDPDFLWQLQRDAYERRQKEKEVAAAARKKFTWIEDYSEFEATTTPLTGIDPARLSPAAQKAFTAALRTLHEGLSPDGHDAQIAHAVEQLDVVRAAQN